MSIDLILSLIAALLVALFILLVHTGEKDKFEKGDRVYNKDIGRSMRGYIIRKDSPYVWVVKYDKFENDVLQFEGSLRKINDSLV